MHTICFGGDSANHGLSIEDTVKALSNGGIARRQTWPDGKYITLTQTGDKYTFPIKGVVDK